MKKNYLLIILIFFSQLLFAQVVYNFEEQKAMMENVVELQNLSKETIYDRARIWAASKLKSSDNQSFDDDKNKEVFIGTGNIMLNDHLLYNQRIVNYKISLYFKEDRYKYIISELVYSFYHPGSGVYNTFDLNKEYQSVYSKKKFKQTKLLIEIDEAFISLMTDLEKTVKNEIPSKSSDW